MIKNYIKTAFRSLVRNKLHSFINILGLAMGIATFILIMIYIRHELSYDEFHKNKDNIYKVKIDFFGTAAPEDPQLIKKFSEIEEMVRLDFYYEGGKKVYFQKVNDIGSKEVADFICADSSFFDMFSFQFLYGDPKFALKDPNNIVLTKSTAIKVFGKENVVGESIICMDEDGDGKINYKITGVIEDVPDNSSIRFNCVGSFSTIYSIIPSIEEKWGWKSFELYIKINENKSYIQLENEIGEFVNKQFRLRTNDEYNYVLIAELLPLNEVKFYDNNKSKLIIIMTLIGFIIISLAIINFIKLSIAKSSMRAKEIGIRKINGASRFKLIKQFISEAILYSFIATAIAILISELAIPTLNEITGKELSIGYLEKPYLLILIAFGALLIGIISGLYPALYLSSFKSIKILKNKSAYGKNMTVYRQALIIFQFIISLSLLIGTIAISRQLNYVKNYNLGINTGQIINLNLNTPIANIYKLSIIYRHQN